MLQNINEADAGVKKLADDIEKAKAQYTSKLAGFESTNSQIKTGLSAEIAKVNDEINKLGTNNGSIQNLKVAFDNLTASANKIKENLKATGASLNPIDNAINKYKNMDNVLKEITTSFNNLSIKPTGLGDSLNSVKSQLIELQNLEKSEGGYTETWAKKYRDVSLAVAEVKTNIELALKAEKFVQLTNVPGVLRNIDDSSTLIKRIERTALGSLKATGIIAGGMIPKIECCLTALEGGVPRTHIIDGRVPHSLLIEMFSDRGIGTMIY